MIVTAIICVLLIITTCSYSNFSLNYQRDRTQRKHFILTTGIRLWKTHRYLIPMKQNNLDFFFLLLYYDTCFLSLHQGKCDNIVIGLFTQFYEYMIVSAICKNIWWWNGGCCRHCPLEGERSTHGMFDVRAEPKIS